MMHVRALNVHLEMNIRMILKIAVSLRMFDLMLDN